MSANREKSKALQDRIIELHAKGCTVSAMSSRLGIGQVAVFKRLRAIGLQANPPNADEYGEVPL